MHRLVDRSLGEEVDEELWLVLDIEARETSACLLIREIAVRHACEGDDIETSQFIAFRRIALNDDDSLLRSVGFVRSPFLVLGLSIDDE